MWPEQRLACREHKVSGVMCQMCLASLTGLRMLARQFAGPKVGLNVCSALLGQMEDPSVIVVHVQDCGRKAQLALGWVLAAWCGVVQVSLQPSSFDITSHGRVTLYHSALSAMSGPGDGQAYRHRPGTMQSCV